jgi:hypothetical protein
MNDDYSPSTRLRHELSYLGDSAISAAREGQLGRVEESLAVLTLLVETFLEELKRLGGGYSRQLADREIHSLEGGWHEMEWVGETYRGVLDAALHLEDREVVRQIVAFPHRLARLAIRYEDQYVFQEFLRWVPYAYHAATAISSPTRTLITSVTGTQLRETLEWVVRPLMEHAESEDELVRQLDFSLVVLAQFNQLMKEAHDTRQVQDFCDFAGEVRTAVAALVSLNGMEELAERLVDVGRRVAAAEAVLYLGHDAWLIHSLESKRITFDEWETMRACLAIPDDTQSLWRAYLDARAEQWGDLMNWRNWELDEAPRGTVIGIPTDFRLSLAVLVESLRLMAGDREVEVPSPEEAKSWDSEDSDMRLALAQIADSPQLMRAAGNPSREAIAELQKQLAGAAAGRRADEAALIAGAPLSTVRFSDVVTNIEEGWEEAGRFRYLFERSDLVRLSGEPPPELAGFGLTNWDLKVLYVDEPPSHWSTSGWGAEYGRSLGAGEDATVFKALIGDHEPQQREVGTPDEVRGVIDEGIKTLAKRGGEHLQIALNGSWIGFLAVTESPVFEPESDTIDRWAPVLGRYGGYPVVNLLSPDPDLIVIFDSIAACQWEQYVPPSERSDFSIQARIREAVTVEMKEIDVDEARTLFSEKSVFREVRGKKLTTEEAVLELRTRVLIRVLEWFEFRVERPELVWVAQGPEI